MAVQSSPPNVGGGREHRFSTGQDNTLFLNPDPGGTGIGAGLRITARRGSAYSGIRCPGFKEVRPIEIAFGAAIIGSVLLPAKGEGGYDEFTPLWK